MFKSNRSLEVFKIIFKQKKKGKLNKSDPSAGADRSESASFREMVNLPISVMALLILVAGFFFHFIFAHTTTNHLLILDGIGTNGS